MLLSVAIARHPARLDLARDRSKKPKRSLSQWNRSLVFVCVCLCLSLSRSTFRVSPPAVAPFTRHLLPLAIGLFPAHTALVSTWPLLPFGHRFVDPRSYIEIASLPPLTSGPCLHCNFFQWLNDLFPVHTALASTPCWRIDLFPVPLRTEIASSNWPFELFPHSH